jgi:putative transposase
MASRSLSFPGRREQVIEALRFASEKRDWRLVAWVVLANHYHAILKASDSGAHDLPSLVASVHRFTARHWNAEDGLPGRQVWYQYWDTCLTHAGSFWARLNYIHHNPVKHGLAEEPDAYSWSSYRVWLNYSEFDLPRIEGAHPWDLLDLE